MTNVAQPVGIKINPMIKNLMLICLQPIVKQVLKKEVKIIVVYLRRDESLSNDG